MFHTSHSALFTLHLRKGFTLVEALVVMMIMALIGGAIMAFYPASAKLFQRGGARSQAESACSQAIKEMAPIVREAMNLNVAPTDGGTGADRLEVSLPLKQTDPTTGEDLVVYPLTVGKEVAFYRSDESGSPGVTGEYFWRAEKVGGTWQPSEVLAQGISSFNAFSPPLDETPEERQVLYPKRVEVVVSSQATLGSRQATVTHREHLMCRNT